MGENNTVNFSNETTVTVAPADLVKIIILQKWDNFNLSQEHYIEHMYANRLTSVDLPILRSRLMSLFNCIQATLKRRLKDDKYNGLLKTIQTGSYEQIIEASQMINEELDSMGLLKIDTKQVLGGDLIERNKRQGVPQ